ncbi:MAG: hypothetical protein Kow0029_15170 [Candidatus Rifleibacteriota bacterium]
MRKFLVLLLLVALVPFTVGCNGLWDFDDDDDDPVAYKTLTSKASFPAAAVSAGGNIRGALAYSTLKLVIGGVTFTPSSATYNDAGTPNDTSDDTVEVTFTATVAVTSVPTGSQTMTITSGTTTLVTATIDLGTTAPDSVTVTVSGTVAGGTFTPTAVNFTVTSGTSTTTPATATITSTGGITVPSFSVTGVTYGATAVTSSETTAITVNTLNPTFRVNFSAAPANLTTATWEVYVKNMTTGVNFTLTSTAYPTLFTATAVGNAVDVKLAGATGKALRAGQTYMVQLKASDLKDANGTLLDPVAAFYFKTAATTFTPTTLTDYTGKSANIDVGTSTQEITLTFSGNVELQPTGTVKLIRYADSARTTKEAEMTIDATTATYAYGASNAIVKVTFNQPFVSGKFYTVENLTGTWLDANGNPVEGVASIDFATN